MKKIVRLTSIFIIIFLLCGLAMTFSGCKKEPSKPVFEIRLYDDNWQELERHYFGDEEDNNYSYSFGKCYEFEYDGEKKGFNAIAYMNGNEFARYTYKNKNPDPLDIFDVSKDMASETDQIKRGSYLIMYRFDTMNNHHRKITMPFGTIYLDDLPINLVQTVNMKIK